jgi:hypothetical protein
MKSVRLISQVLFYVTRLLSILYAAIFLHAFIAIIFKTGHYNITANGNRFEIYYPFTSKPFLLGDNHTTYILFDFLLLLISYGLFFLLLSNVFNGFAQPKLFTKKGYKYLRWFYLCNLLIPLVILLLLSIFYIVSSEATIIVLLHMVAGIFAWFLAVIFRQGLQLQNEQDLFI